MRWGKRQPQQQQQERKSPSSSTFSLFSWISKLKQIATKPKKTAAEPNPSPRSPPPPALTRSASFHDANVDVSRRLSVGEDARSHLRSSRHKSLGGLDFRPTFHLAEPHRISRRWPKELLDPDFATSDIDGDALGNRCRSTRRRRRRRSEKTRMYLEPSDPDRRRSFGRKIRPRPKVRVCSPRSVERRKAVAISAEEDEMVEGLEGFAVVKCSCDPQRDFRDSMVEMIWDRGIGRPEELERLLACYLSLNSDEHHDVIVKVFRQVWFDMNPDRFVSDRNRFVSSAV